MGDIGLEAPVASRMATIRDAINAALADALADDAMVLVFGEDVADPEEGGVLGVTAGLSSRFGEERVRSTPISEQAIVGAAIGVSLRGYKPVAEIMLMNFTTVAMDMIVNHAAKLRFMSGGQTNVPIVIRTMTGSGYSNGGQHSDYLEAWFAHTAGMKVVCPASPADAYGLMRSAIDDPDPVMYIENLPTYMLKGGAWEPGRRIAIGKGQILREGTDVTIVTYARMVQESMKAAEALSKNGISVELIDLRSIQPWDRELVLASVARTRAALVVHEAALPFGPAGEISSVIHEELFNVLKGPVRRIGGAFCAVPFSKPLETAFAPQAAGIAQAVRTMLLR